MSEIDLDNIIEVKQIRKILDGKDILLLFFNELVEMCNKKEVSVELVLDELNEYDEDLEIDNDYETGSEDEERWD